MHALGYGGLPILVCFQIPFIRWFDELPVVGFPIGAALYGLSNPFASNIMRLTGKQFFFLDGTEEKDPLLVGFP